MWLFFLNRGEKIFSFGFKSVYIYIYILQLILILFGFNKSYPGFFFSLSNIDNFFFFFLE